MPQRKQSKRAAKLASHFRQLKREAQLRRLRERFKPTRRERDSFVFVDTVGRRKDVGSRAKGFLFYVDSAGRRHLQSLGKSKEPRPFRDYDVSLSKKPKAIAKLEKRYGFKSYGEPVSVRSGESVTMESLGRKLRGRLGEFIGRFGSRNVMVVEMRVHTRGKILRTQFMLTASELKAFEQGKKKFLPRLAWKAISTELSVEDMVAVTSAAFIAALTMNKGKRKAGWTDDRGGRWGKSGYKKVKISQIDIKIKVSTKRTK